MANLKAVSVERYGRRRWRRFTDYRFAGGDAGVPITSREVPRAVLFIPVAFVRAGEAFELVAVQGLKAGQNLMVSPDGVWRGGYRPALYRCHPFLLARPAGAESNERVLCFDEDSGLLVDGDAPTGQAKDGTEPFFGDDGKPTETIGRVFEFLGQHANGLALTKRLCADLERAGLIVAWDIRWKNAQGKNLTVEGLFRVDERALNALPFEELGKLRDVGALAVAYGQLFSTAHMPDLLRLADAGAAAESPQELSFGRLEDGGSINFDNL